VYDAARGRFFGRDAYDYDLQNPQTINRYVYALNNSANMYDWSGLCGESSNQTYLSAAPSGFKGFLNSSYNFYKGAKRGLWEGITFQTLNSKNTNDIQSTYSDAYNYGYNIVGLPTTIANIALAVGTEGGSAAVEVGGQASIALGSRTLLYSENAFKAAESSSTIFIKNKLCYSTIANISFCSTIIHSSPDTFTSFPPHFLYITF
jgi:hypothetical protein